MNTMKKIIALCLVAVLTLGCFAACGNSEQTETTAPVATEDPAEAKVLKVLTLGHSLATNATRLLALIANAEGYEDMVVGTLYYSGCPLSKHVEFLTNNSREYTFYVSSTTTANEPPKGMDGASMLDAITYDYWDVIVMQGGTSDLVLDTTYTNGDIQTIQKYVNEHKKNPNAVFSWHMPWAFATDPDLASESPFKGLYESYDNDRVKLFDAFAKLVNDYIVTDETFVSLIPSGAAVENAITSYMTEKDMLCDYAHATDLGRVIAAYTYFCVLTGVEKLDQVKLDAIPKRLVSTSIVSGDRVLTDADKALIIESVNNALANPLQITQSQYTQEPEGYIQVPNKDG